MRPILLQGHVSNNSSLLALVTPITNKHTGAGSDPNQVGGNFAHHGASNFDSPTDITEMATSFSHVPRISTFAPGSHTTERD
jgi:hypothetical protein